jgi:magnesium transporter
MKNNDTEQLSNQILNEIEQFKDKNISMHPYDISLQLLKLRDEEFESYVAVVKKIPSSLFADILSEMPIYVQEEISKYVSTKKLVNITSNMDTDDASTFIQNLSEENEQVAQDILENLEEEEKEILEQLISYESHQTGSYMQVELFSANINSNIGLAIKNLKKLKEEGKVNNIWHCHLVDSTNKYIGSIGLEELIIFDHHLSFLDISNEKLKQYSVNHKENIKDATDMVVNYNLTSLPVVDDNNKLIGRITADDVHDIIQVNATEQLYNMAGVNDTKEQEESIYQIGKSRAFWLGINLLTAIMASVVIGIFDATIQSLVALAVLMPIVASMGGNAGTQTLTVTVRQMTLGDICIEDAKKTIKKEVTISFVNGMLFAFIIGVISYLWFKLPLLGVVIAISMIINLLSAGFFGAIIPLGLQRVGIDPAIGSTVLLTTVTDMVGFFSFLGLSTIILL